MTNEKRLLTNSLTGMVLYVETVIIAYLISPVLIRALGNTEYGVWEVILSFCGYLGILEFGVGPAIIKYVASAEARNDTESLKLISTSAFLGLAAIGVIAFAIASVCAMRPDVVIGVRKGEIAALSTLFLVVGLTLWTQFTGTFFTAFLMGAQQHHKINIVRCLLSPIQALAIYAIATEGEHQKLLYVALAGLAANLIQYAVFAFMVLRRQEVRFRRDLFSWKVLRGLYAFGWSSALLMVSDRIQKQSIPFVLSHTLGAATVVYYAIPRRLVDYARSFVLTLSFPMMPYFSAVDAGRIAGEPIRQWVPASRAVAFCAIPGAILLLTLGKQFIADWIGESYAIEGRWVLLLLGGTLFVSGVFANSTNVLVGCGRHGPPARKLLIISLLAVSAAIGLSKHLGPAGAALVVALADIAGTVVLWRAVSPEVGISLVAHLKLTAIPLVIPGILMAVVVAVGLKLLPVSGLLDLLGVSIAAVLAYLVSGWFFAIKTDERRAILARTKRILGSM